MADRERVHTDRAPAAIGPYSQAIVSGGFIFTAGQIALDPASGEMVGEDAPAQAERALQSLAAVLEAAGSNMKKVVKCTVFLVDMGEFAAVNEVYARYFDEPFPARSAVQAAALPRGARVEIEAIARLA
ncbi:MAG: RidA family protein [Gemmatimonadota bacterium]|nr:MAG: RidA family protein [Gemmatimonadota bacterium]